MRSTLRSLTSGAARTYLKVLGACIIGAVLFELAASGAKKSTLENERRASARQAVLAWDQCLSSAVKRALSADPSLGDDKLTTIVARQCGGPYAGAFVGETSTPEAERTTKIARLVSAAARSERQDRVVYEKRVAIEAAFEELTKQGVSFNDIKDFVFEQAPDACDVVD